MVMSMFSPAKPFPATIVVDPPAPETVVWDDVPGIYLKIGIDQLDSSTQFPTNYLTNFGNNSFPASVYYDLLHYKWLRGIQIDLLWGDVETSVGVYDWTKYDKIFEIIEGLAAKGLNGADKKVMFLLSSTKVFAIADASRILPSYLLSTGTAYSNASTGPLYTTSGGVNTFIDMPRYDHLWGYDSNSNQATTSGFGYHLRTGDYRNGLTGVNRNNNGGATAEEKAIGYLKAREYAFLQAVYNRYKDSPVLAGFISIEPSPLEFPVDMTGTFNGGRGNEVEYVEADSFDGRIQRLKDLKQIFTNHMLVECCTHNTPYQSKMTVPITNLNGDCCITNGFGFTAPNFHLGVNTLGLHNARRYMHGEVPIVVQCQGQDMESIKGVTIANYWQWDYIPPDYGGTTAAGVNQGHPTTKISGAPLPNNAHLGANGGGEWVIRRSWYFRANILVFQRITGHTAKRPWTYPEFVQYMQTDTVLTNPLSGVLITNDPYGGMIYTKPTRVV